eukprot:CAMPEP_0183703602 /NCGR_PEP_ID=MMETSP0737-20130205/1295_1 /TAXON_ID=385413 /ORGANISM="Thalassiosira miniscula, Strain CCMP1093" /LENGTH=424 /DNA_ID=CAMNT_0025930391 /DNA_START=112 /DNA_END=1386 /DNA_ORIENTATION=+
MMVASCTRIFGRRSLSSTANTTPPSSTKLSSSSPSPSPPSSRPRLILNEQTLLSQLSPLKRIVCLCPVPLGRNRVSWSGGDNAHHHSSSYHPPDDETINLDYQSSPSETTRNVSTVQPLTIKKYRYAERYALGVAVTDPYLTHAQPVPLSGGGGGGGGYGYSGSGDYGYGDDDGLKRRFVAEIVPTFRCDAHNLGSSPIFHTNFPYFRNDFLQHIGHFDIGAIVVAMPMKQTRNPLCPTPTKVQLEQERKLDQVREYILGILQNYITVDEDYEEEEDAAMSGSGSSGLRDGGDGVTNNNGNSEGRNNHHHRRPKFLGPLNLQGRIDHRLTIPDVLSKTNNQNYNNDCQSSGNWNHITKSLQQIQNMHTIGEAATGGRKSTNYFLGNREYAAHNVFSSVPPEMHAAVALNTMMEKYTSGYHNSFF